MISAAHHVISRHQRLLYRGCRAAPQDYRFTQFRELLQKRVVPHVSFADLYDVDVAREERQLRRVEDRRMRQHPMAVSHFTQQFQSFLTQALKAIRIIAGPESSST